MINDNKRPKTLGWVVSHPALRQAGHKASVYLSPNYSVKAAWTSQRPIGQIKRL